MLKRYMTKKYRSAVSAQFCCQLRALRSSSVRWWILQPSRDATTLSCMSGSQQGCSQDFVLVGYKSVHPMQFHNSPTALIQYTHRVNRIQSADSTTYRFALSMKKGNIWEKKNKWVKWSCYRSRCKLYPLTAEFPVISWPLTSTTWCLRDLPH